MKLKPWYQVITPREDLRENRPMDASEFAVHLDHIRQKRENVSQDYINPVRFFERTSLTTSLLDLASQVVRRLSGIQVETSAVFNMATQFGGGKTHSLTTLWHLATSGEKANSYKGVDKILAKAQVPQVPQARRAVFVGTEFDAIQGRGGDGEPVRKTPWGEIAWQLNGQEGFDLVAEHDAKGIAPGGDVLQKLLGDQPALILIDELMNYISRARKLEMRDQFFVFLQSLCEEARAHNNVVVCVSIPASEDLEMSPEDVRDFQSLKKLLDRLGKAIMMSADAEIAEIIRRRLFEWDLFDVEAGKVATAYADWAVEHAQELSGIDPDTAHATFKSCYPFHPSVLSVFERKWQSLPRFQRTRGILRLLALWVAHAYQDEHRKAMREPLITLGSAPLEDPIFRSAMFEQLGSNELEVPLTTDIAGKKDAHAVRLDREASDAIKKANLHRKVASAIFFESNGGMSQGKAVATLPEIRAAVGSPDLNMVDVDNVLEGLVGSCYYLNWDRNRYRFGLSPNLNQILVTRRGAVQPKEISERIKKETQELFNKGTKALDRRFFPERSNDVPNRPVLTLVVMGLDQQATDRSTEQLLETIVRDCGNSGRTYKSALIFAVADSSDAIQDATRDVLAWQAIEDDGDTCKQLDEGQERLLKRNLGRAKSDLKESIWRSYRYLYLLGKDNKIRQIDLGQITSSMANSIVELYVNELSRTDEITSGVGANKLLKYWPPALTEWSTKGVRDAFFSSPQLPRLLDADTIKRTIADGVSHGTLGYAIKESSGQFKLMHFNESMPESDVEIADDVFILKAEEAQKLLEPPRLERIDIRPSDVTLKPGEKASFSVNGFDQYGETYSVSDTKWSATSGEISEDGLYQADEESTGGLFTVKAESEGLESIAEIRVVNPQATDPNPDPGGGGGSQSHKKAIRWEGTVPPQKWMNFYTKVLSRFASTEGLKLNVSFEVPAEGEQGQAKADEARSGLKELGLDDDVKLG
ncbi:MAG TPA: AAA family ATPase [Planctomycetaceae bacterium]|nr:AAA family ATPase [Planctomycetaceae bacterium]